MATLNKVQTKKISELTTLSKVTGNEYLLVSTTNNSYKIKLSDLLSTYITNITEDLHEGDDAISYVYTYFGLDADNTNNVTVFEVKNGSKGSTGDTGETGKTGAQGAHGLIYKIDDEESVLAKITDSLNSDDNSKVLSAAAGQALSDAVSDLKEVYLYSQDTMDTLIAENKYADNVKYYIYDEDDVDEDEVDDLSAITADKLVSTK